MRMRDLEAELVAHQLRVVTAAQKLVAQIAADKLAPVEDWRAREALELRLAKAVRDHDEVAKEMLGRLLVAKDEAG